MKFTERVRVLYKEMGYEPAEYVWIDQTKRECCPLSIITMDRCLKSRRVGEVNDSLDGEGSFYLLVASVIKNHAFLTGFITGWDGQPKEGTFWFGQQQHKLRAHDRAWEIGSSLRKEFGRAGSRE